MQFKSIAECSAILSTFIILPFAIKIAVYSIFEWPLKTGFVVTESPILAASSCTQIHICVHVGTHLQYELSNTNASTFGELSAYNFVSGQKCFGKIYVSVARTCFI